MLLQFLINGTIVGILYGLSAIGFALIYNATRILHIAAAALYVAAAYIFHFTYQDIGLPLWIAGIIALAITAGLSVLIELIVYYPLYKRKASHNIAMVASIGVMTILINVVALIFGNETKLLDNTIKHIFTFGEIIITTPQILQVGIGIILICVLFAFLELNGFGLRIRALCNNATLFEILGFNIKATRLIVFAISGIFLAAGSCLTVYDIGMNPHIGMPILINAMVAMIIGGIGSFKACIIGGLLLGILQALVVFQFSPNWQNAVTFLVLLLFLFFCPEGIFGYKKRLV